MFDLALYMQSCIEISVYVGLSLVSSATVVRVTMYRNYYIFTKYHFA